LKTFPVGLRLLRGTSELEDFSSARRVSHKATLCQLMTIARTAGWTIGAQAEDLVFAGCASIIGLSELPEYYRDGTMRSKIWVKTKQDAAKAESSVPRVPLGQYKAVILGPQVSQHFDPDALFIYANPAQMALLINAIQFDRYDRMTFYSVGEDSCADVIGRCLIENVPAMSVPCFGERRFGHASDDELSMGLPPSEVERIVNNLDELYRRGVRYPIPPWGAFADPTSLLKKLFGEDGY
jgi:uncharacterized protein (DUF169 family)